MLRSRWGCVWLMAACLRAMRQVGVVEQQAGLLSGSIASNISYGKVGTSISLPFPFLATDGRERVPFQEGATLDEIRRAAVQADAHDFISALPDGYDTKVMENKH